MCRYVTGLFLWMTAGGVALGSTYTVTTTADSGAGSLRSAINSVNKHKGPDEIRFGGAVAGKVIRPLTRLPGISDAYTTIVGDMDEIVGPDVTLDGVFLSDLFADYGLRLSADHCTVSRMCIVRFPLCGIQLRNASHCSVVGCLLGVNRSGVRDRRNGIHYANMHWGDVMLEGADDNVIGGPSFFDRNVMGAGDTAQLWTGGVTIRDGDRNLVINNCIGVTTDGNRALGKGHIGVFINPQNGATADGNWIGGPASWNGGNLIGGARTGISLNHNTTNTWIEGNRFGLGADGETVIPIGDHCIAIDSGGTGTHIGGAGRGTANVFAGGAQNGVYLSSAAGTNIRIQGNYFGLNADGTAFRPLATGIRTEAPEGTRLTIGGATKAAGNTFTPSGVAGGVGVRVYGTSNPTIRSNTFGARPNGGAATSMLAAIHVKGSSPRITNNTIANGLLAGVQIESVGSRTSNPGLFGNLFRDCSKAVYVLDSRCRLGNLSNASRNDDGGNVFKPGNDWHIYNSSPNLIKAEGNSFGTTSRALINAKVYDRLDDPSNGRVDYDPLVDGIHPSEVGGPLQVTGLSAATTAAGAQITFALTSAAVIDARVLNIAGRPVATVCTARNCAAGTNTLLWNARSDRGLPVPTGTYLIEVGARAEGGTLVRALAQTRIGR